MTGLLVLDFDGTMTDAEREGAPYRTGVLEDVALLTGWPQQRVFDRAAEVEAEIAANPHAHGWQFGGQIVAPASVDPYLRIMPVARQIFDEAGVYRDEADRARLLEGLLYKYNYRKTAIAFRDGARETLLAMTGKPVYVVTNSHTDAVQDKIRHLGGGGDGGPLSWLVPRVFGSARKFVLDDSFDAVPSEMRLPGLDRPVLLRRRDYHDALFRLLREQGCDWSDLVVCGDIFELDLALPMAMGARVGLVVNPFTPPWEKAFLADHPRGALLTDVPSIRAFCGWDD
ncbi:MAG: HAD family hydrolase [Deltaproteobacteria bacterium]|nr:HAD family hydrolase [Deltaproteobacteria bacterium]